MRPPEPSVLDRIRKAATRAEAQRIVDGLARNHASAKTKRKWTQAIAAKAA